MSKNNKKDEDKVVVIPENQRDSEVEAMVKYYMDTTPNLPLNEKLPERLITPDFDSPSERRNWQVEQIKRCKNGYNGITGKMYFFYNFVFMKDLVKGKIRPEFRVCDNEWFKLIEQVQNESNGWGIVCVKRRRVGASWKEAADVVHDMIFRKYYHVGVNSKSDNDSVHLFRKMMFIYENLPAFMKANVGTKNGMKVEYFIWGKDEAGNKIRKGNQNELTVVAPTDSAYEGLMLHKWVCDEAGKIDNLRQIWSYTEECLMQEMVRVGVPILFGTSGDISKDGMGLAEKWENSEIYKLHRFFFAGWMGLAVDEYGNDRKEECIRWLLYERKKREKLDKKQYIDFIQKYPLTPDEAFSKYSLSGLGDPVLINAQLTDLKKNPPFEKRGRFRFDEEFNVRFIPEKFGPIIIYEDPNPLDSYIGGVDPADHDDATNDTSDLSTHIFKEGDGLEPDKIVCEYVDRPKNLSEYYNQVIALCMYYNKCRLLIENNRYRMISHMDNLGYKNLLYYTPPAITRLIKSRPSTLGIKMTRDVKEFMEGAIEDYLMDFTEYIPSKDLLIELLEYGSRNTDRVMSFGISLMLLRSRKKMSKKRKTSSKVTKAPDYSFVRTPSGIKRVSNSDFKPSHIRNGDYGIIFDENNKK